jgi:hypothetical protein
MSDPCRDQHERAFVSEAAGSLPVPPATAAAHGSLDRPGDSAADVLGVTASMHSGQSPTPTAHELARLEGQVALDASLMIVHHAGRLPDESVLRSRMLERAAQWEMLAAICGVTSDPA